MATTEHFGQEAPSTLALHMAAALHADSDHGRDGEDLELTGGPRSICNCVHKARIAAGVLVHVGYQWCDDGRADGGLLSIDTSLRLGDSRCKPVYRVRIADRDGELSHG